MASTTLPDSRFDHESALIGDDLYVFGGKTADNGYFFPREEIWTCNVRDKKWMCRVAEGDDIPPSCNGAQCVVIDGIIYSYGGRLNKGDGDLEDVFGLNPQEMKWLRIATRPHEKKPWKRHEACLWAIGGRFIMFGGGCDRIPPDHLQLGAKSDWEVNDELYEFIFEENREKGHWLDLCLDGFKPSGRRRAATETIDRHRGLIHGGYQKYKYVTDSFVIDLRAKQWIQIGFSPVPSYRSHHRICRLPNPGLKERNRFVLVGGEMNEKNSDHAFVLDFDSRKSYEIHLCSDIEPIWLHTLHCVRSGDEIFQVFVVGGRESGGKFIDLLIDFTFQISVKKEGLESKLAISKVPNKTASEESQLQERLQALQEEAAKAQRENLQLKSDLAAQRLAIETQRNTSRALRDSIKSLTEDLNEQKIFRFNLEEEKEKLAETLQESTRHTENLVSERSEMERHCASLEEQMEILTNEYRRLEIEAKDKDDELEAKVRTAEEFERDLCKFKDVLSIAPDQVTLTNEKLGSGAYADVIIGRWHGISIAVKKFHDLITTLATIPSFQREVLVASRLHHPNIIRICGAVMEEKVPFQIVFELLEGSVSEVITAAHLSTSYLSSFEQLSIVVEMTSAIAYLHGLEPCPYVHADIRPTNVLVTKDMKVKVADLGAAHLLESSKSVGPLSPQYLAPERMPPSSARSSLASDVYSLGVSLIEIFTGVRPIPEERYRQLSQMKHRLRRLCSRMISEEDRRPKSRECLDVLIREKEEVIKSGEPPEKRMVNGMFEGEGTHRCHKVVLSDYLF